MESQFDALRGSSTEGGFCPFLSAWGTARLGLSGKPMGDPVGRV